MKFELKMRLLLVMNVNCEIYIYKHIYIDLNDCYLKCLSYINDVKTNATVIGYECYLRNTYKYMYIDLNYWYSKYLSNKCMCACVEL